MSTPFYDLASLVVVPSGYKSGKIYAQKPLTTDGQLTFTRASTATRVNASGLIETVSSGVPRLDYTNSSCPKILLEPQRSNLLTYSEQFDNAAWSKNATTVSANAATSPDGTTNADKLIVDNGASLSSISNYALQSITKAASAIQYTYSTFAKQGGLNRVNIIAQGASVANNASATFSLVNGTIATAAAAAGAFTGASASVSDYGNGWYRCTLVFTTNTDTDLIIRNIPTDSTLTTGNGTNGILIYGAQLEAGAYATSYIPTTSAAVTRLGDVATKTGISSLIGQTEGTLFVDVSGESLQDNSRYMSISDFNDPNKRITIYQASGKINVYCSAGSTFNLDYNPPAGRLKIAFGYKSGQYVLYVNGVNAASSTESVVQGCPDLGIAVNEYLGTANPPAVGYNQALLFKTRLTNAQLAELTTL
jgi:hypothetical protein